MRGAKQTGWLLAMLTAVWEALACSKPASGDPRDASGLQTVRSVEPTGEPPNAADAAALLEVEAPLSPAAPPGACPGDMIYVPGGTFTMGDDENVRQARHDVTLSAYCMDRTEVTLGAYKRCLQAKACTPPKRGALECNYNHMEPDLDAHPVNCVNWVQAHAYCRWAKKRLPTEAEWEFAARGTDGRHYPWGSNPVVPPYAEGMNAVEPHWAVSTVPVGSRPGDVSPFGLLDMGQNVTEWVADWEAPYGALPQVDPQGPKTGRLRVGRGDNYRDPLGVAGRASERRAGHPLKDAMGEIGLRCARSVSSLRDATPDQAVHSVEPATEPAPAAATSPPEVEAHVAPAPFPDVCPGDMIYVPGGTFTMGDDENVRQARHDVTLSAYCIDRTEVTLGAYMRCLRARACTPPKLGAPGCNYLEPERDAHPVNCVNWVQASTYCRWAKKRLPTEAEWEFAARGTDGRRYPWGNDPEVPPYAEGVKVDWAGGTVPAGSRPGDVSPFGVLDMGESVTEWVADWDAPYGTRPQSNPIGPVEGHLRIRRGGNYDSHTRRASHRSAGPPIESAMGQIGLRCARSVSAATSPR